MIQDFQLRLVPEVAYDMQQIKLHIANTNGLKTLEELKSNKITESKIKLAELESDGFPILVKYKAWLSLYITKCFILLVGFPLRPQA